MLSVIIPTYKRFDKVEKLCHILAPVKCVGEILLVGSEVFDFQKRDKLIGGKIKYILAPENSVALKRNIGARESKFDCICFLDDDVVIDSYSINLLNTLLQSEKNVIYCGSVKYKYRSSRGADLFLKYRNKRAMLGTVGSNSWKHFVSMYFGCSKKIFNMLGGFDERIKGYGAEEYSFAVSAQKNAVPVYFNLCMVGYHDEVDTSIQARNKKVQMTIENGLRYIEENKIVVSMLYRILLKALTCMPLKIKIIFFWFINKIVKKIELFLEEMRFSSFPFCLYYGLCRFQYFLILISTLTKIKIHPELKNVYK